MPDFLGEAELAGFRGRLTGRYGLDLLDEGGGRMVIQLPVGVGKSRFMDAITAEAVLSGDRDLVTVLAPTHQLIRERGPLRDPPRGVRVVVLRSRPAERCGPERDARWRRHEAADLGALGRAEICGPCPFRRGCFWPDQYGRALEGARIVYATHAQIERSPDFLLRLQSWTGSSRSLTLIDEAEFAGKSLGRAIRPGDMVRFFDALRAATAGCADPDWQHGRWLELAEMLRGASTDDLQDPAWRMPPVRNGWAAAVQRAGVDRHGDSFRFLDHALSEFGRSPTETRRRGESGAIEFATRFYLGDVIVFTATADRAYMDYRLGGEFSSPFADHQFVHPGTRWSNIASPIGARRYFPRHCDQILDFVAALTARRAAEGKRVLLISKKDLVPACAGGLAVRFAELGADLRVEAAGWTEENLADPRVVPLITYGMTGTNLFEHFDCAFCLNAYYVNAAVLDLCLQDLGRRDLRLEIEIGTVGLPRRRRAGVVHRRDRHYDVARLAQAALEFKEHGTVVQAAGRVRPFTRPREVLTFQMAELPGVRYDAEFRTLGEARRSFGIPAGGDRRRDRRDGRVVALRRDGLTQARVAQIVGVSERTVRNIERREDRKKDIS